MRKRKFKILFQLILFGAFLSDGIPLLSQDPVFKANVSGTRVAQHSIFDIQFELQQADGDDFLPPNFEGFKVVGGPSLGSSTMIINGVVSQSQSWSYTLLALKRGKYTIGPAYVIAGRKKMNTNSITIEVVEAKEEVREGATSGTREHILLKAEVDADSYYPGQQMILTYRLLFRENVQTVSTLAEDDYADFYVQHFNNFSRDATMESINGKQFTSRIIKSMALFAHQSGSYTIDPMLMNVGINAPFPGNQGFFTMRRIQDIQVASEPLKISIIPLPQGAPANFTGAVGQYQIKSIPGKTQISTDEAFTMRIEILGNGDSRRWDPPTPVTSGDFEIYDPKIIEDKLMDAGNRFLHSRTMEYQMIPSVPGDYKIFVPLSFFDPDVKKFVSLSSDTITLRVTQGKSLHDEKITSIDDAVAPTLMNIRRTWFNDRFWTSMPHLLLFGLLLSSASFACIVMYKRKIENRIPEAEQRRALAGRRAKEQFNQLESEGSALTDKEFMEQAAEIYYKFLLDRYQIPPSALDEERLPGYLSSAGLSDDVANRAMLFFKKCITIRYSGALSGYSKEKMLDECRELIVHM